MCLIGLAWQAHSDIALLVAANRDEYHARPSAASAWWSDAPQVLAGRDLQSGGTWMGVTRAGRFAALTNVRDPAPFKAVAPSRGALVAGYLTGQGAASTWTGHSMVRADAYNGFNLLAGTVEALWYCGNRGAPAQALQSGVYALSNALLDTPWPKVTSLKLALGAALQDYTAGDAHPPRVLDGEAGAFSKGTTAATPPDAVRHANRVRDDVLFDALFQALGDTRPQPDERLPHTGVPLERERLLSSPKIIAPLYGTRASTVLSVFHNGQVRWEERSFTPEGVIAHTVREQFSLSAGSAVPRSVNARMP